MIDNKVKQLGNRTKCLDCNPFNSVDIVAGISADNIAKPIIESNQKSVSNLEVIDSFSMSGVTVEIYNNGSIDVDFNLAKISYSPGLTNPWAFSKTKHIQVTKEKFKPEPDMIKYIDDKVSSMYSKVISECRELFAEKPTMKDIDTDDCEVPF
jgi:hypothetical protein